MAPSDDLALEIEDEVHLLHGLTTTLRRVTVKLPDLPDLLPGWY
jgi:hypothetical protein